MSFTDDASNAETTTAVVAAVATAVVSAAANSPATGAPTITGTPQVGETLTAATTAIMDANGLTTPGYTYQWIRVATDSTETNISMATASTYTLVTDDLGTTIKVKVSFTDDASNAETRTSVATAVVAAASNTAATGQPAITGTAQVGQLLTAVTTAIMDANGLNNVSYTYQWIRVATDTTETNIGAATASTYTLVIDDLGTTIKVKVSFTDDASNAETRTSVATAAVTAAPAQSEVTLVGNAGQPTGERHTASFQGAVDHAQQFATGSNALGYTLTKVEFLSNDAQGHTFSAQFCEANNTGGDAVPDPMNCQTLNTTSSFAQGSVVVFTPPSGMTITLAASTRYVVVLSENNSPSAVVDILSTQADNQNGEAGWTHANVFDWKQNGTTWMKQGSGRDALIMDVKGYATTGTGTNTPPTASNGEVTATEDTDYPFTAANFNFSDTDAGAALSSVKITSLPASGTGTLKVNGTGIASGDLPKAVTKVDIDANKLTYSPPADASGDDYATFQFKVNDGTDDSAIASTMTIDVTAVNDAATGQPAITGTAQVGQLLTAAVGTIADPDGLPNPFLTDTNTSFQWVRVTSGTDDDISGETASTYTLATADEGKTIKVKVSFQDGGGGSEGPLTSVATAVVSAAANSLATGAPTITGTAQVGETLTAATTAIMDTDGLTTPGYTYQWIRVAADNTETNISMAMASTYTLVTDDLGATIKVKVSFTDDASNAETRTSVATAVVAAANAAPTVANAIPDQGATAGTAFRYAFPDTTFTDTDSDTLTYMATKGDGAALPTWLMFTATTRAFSGTPAAADVGTVAVEVTASDGKGGSVSDEFDITVAAAGPSGITLVGNAGQPTGERRTASFQGVVDHAQQFTTGPNAAGDTLTKVEFLSNDAQGHTFSAQLCEANNAGETAVPDPMNCQTLSTTSSFAQNSVVVFTPPSGMTITLAASTRYVVVLSENNDPSAVVDILSTQANNQNGEAGWTLADVFDWNQNGTSWMKQGSGRDALIMDVKGYATFGPPGAVSDVVVVPVPRTPASLQVSWTAPEDTGKPAVTGYDVRYSEEDENNWTTVRQDDAASTSLIISGLPDSYYDVQVRALNADGSGPWSSTAEGASQTGPERVYANHPLIPDDLGVGDSFRLLFITEDTTDATDTGIHDYHDFAAGAVFQLIDPGRLMSAWGTITLGQTALVSTPGADARLITDTTWDETDRGVPIYWLNGARVADDYADFYDGVWADEANPTNDIGEPHSLADPVPWTGTDHDGTELFDGNASRAMGQATVGVGGPRFDRQRRRPAQRRAAFTSTEDRPLYGLWHVLVVDENLRLVDNYNVVSQRRRRQRYPRGREGPAFHHRAPLERLRHRSHPDFEWFRKR